MKQKSVDIGLNIAALLLAAGVFLPLTTLRVVGDVSYQDVAEVEAYLIVAIALAGIVAAYVKPRLTLLAPLAAWATLLFPAIENMFKPDDGGLIAQLRNRANSIMHDFAAELLPDLFSNIADFHWGGFVFLLGLIAFTVFGVLRSIKG